MARAEMSGSAGSLPRVPIGSAAKRTLSPSGVRPTGSASRTTAHGSPCWTFLWSPGPGSSSSSREIRWAANAQKPHGLGSTRAYTPLLAPPTVITRSREDQQPQGADKPLLELVYTYFKDRPYDFEYSRRIFGVRVSPAWTGST